MQHTPTTIVDLCSVPRRRVANSGSRRRFLAAVGFALLLAGCANKTEHITYTGPVDLKGTGKGVPLNQLLDGPLDAAKLTAIAHTSYALYGASPYDPPIVASAPGWSGGGGGVTYVDDRDPERVALEHSAD